MRHYLLSMLFLLVGAIASAQSPEDPYPDYLEEVFLDMDFEQNLVTPTVPNEIRGAVASYMRTVAETFQRQLPDAMKKVIKDDLLKNSNSAIVITYPCDELFIPNDTLFSKFADKSLQPLLPLMKDPFMYKVVYTVNSDNTGSESYRDALTDARMNTIYDWFWKKIDERKIPEELVIIPESFGSEKPVADNLSRENRRQNRRVEFYFIPGPRLIEKLSK